MFSSLRSLCVVVVGPESTSGVTAVCGALAMVMVQSCNGCLSSIQMNEMGAKWAVSGRSGAETVIKCKYEKNVVFFCTHKENDVLT